VILDADEIRDRLEDRWKRLGFDALLPEERDFILVWWLEAEASNGTLHQYFSNSTGDTAIDALGALDRIGAQCAAKVLCDALKLFGDGPYPTDRTRRNKTLDSLSTDAFSHLTDRLFDESEDVRSLAIDRVGDAYIKNDIRDESRSSSKMIRWFAITLLSLYRNSCRRFGCCVYARRLTTCWTEAPVGPIRTFETVLAGARSILPLLPPQQMTSFPRNRYSPAEFTLGYDNSQPTLDGDTWCISLPITHPDSNEIAIWFPGAERPSNRSLQFGREICGQIAQLDNLVQDYSEKLYKASGRDVTSYYLHLVYIELVELTASLEYFGTIVNTQWSAVFTRSESGVWMRKNF
jgi:hypothetical protein